MHRVRTIGRLRRSVAWAAAATLLAVILPGLPASAADLAGSVTLSSGELVVGRSVTFDVTCSGIPNSPGADVALMRIGDGNTVRSAAPTMTQTSTDVYTGQVTWDLTGVTAGDYTVNLQCRLEWGGYHPFPQASGTLTIRAAEVATVTTLSASPTQIVAGEQTTFTASVPGAVGGNVSFQLGGSSLATVPLVNGLAVYTTTLASNATVVAVYSGATGYLTSTSSGAAVSVISSITPPEGFGMGGMPEVGTPLVATVHGQWTPSTEQGLTETYEWRVDNTVVSTAKTYTPTAAQVGKQLTLTITGTHPEIGSHPLVITLPIAAGRGVVGSLTLSGAVDREATLGTPLVAQATGWSPTAVLTYVWYVGGQQVSTAARYTPTAADLGKTIWVDLTATDPGRETLHDSAYVWNVLTTPTVTVGSSTVRVGAKASIPVTVAGPKGGPVPTGTVELTLTPTAGGAPITVDAVTLTSGKATVTVPGLALGRYTVKASYLPNNQIFARYSALASIDNNGNGYRAAVGTGTVTVVKPAPAVTFPATLTVPVATQATGTLTVTGQPRPTEYLVRSGDTELVRGELSLIGDVTVTLPVLAPGTHQLTLVLPETATSAEYTQTVTVTVTGEPARTGSAPTATLDTPKAATAPGQAMDLVADGFQPGETVAFYVHSDPVFLGTAVADANGIARLTAILPAELPVGAHTVIATGGTSGRWAQLPIELAVTPAVLENQLLATTGASAGSGLWSAWLLLAVGAGLVGLVRRVRTVRGAA